MFHVTEYIEEQRYGGPEEGGWWYDERHFCCIRGTFKYKQDALTFRSALRQIVKGRNEELKKAVNEEIANMPDGPSYPDGEGYIPLGQRGGACVIYYIEEFEGFEFKPQHELQGRPVYE